MDPNRRWGTAWLLLCGALGLHVLDEALTGFLSFWNPAVRSLREAYPFLPLPVFRFDVWIGGLIAGVLVLALLSRFAFLGRSWMVPASLVFSVFMMGNGTLHIVGSLYLGRLLPGVYSSPVLLASGVFLWRTVMRLKAEWRDPPVPPSRWESSNPAKPAKPGPTGSR